ncbi:MAG TPA: preprotein translocase subunit TatB [Desulfovibrio sp.]|jgi:TusA-related sulfurtransferase|nr:preprotein translocase subunit TatB [Desulfovibrio sp.]
MAEIIDARGLSCPQPVLDALAAMNRLGAGTLEVLVDTEASKENVSRAAASKGWTAEVQAGAAGEFRLILNK